MWDTRIQGMIHGIRGYRGYVGYKYTCGDSYMIQGYEDTGDIPYGIRGYTAWDTRYELGY